MNKRENKKLLKSMIDDVDKIHDLFGDRVRSLSDTDSYIDISSKLLTLTGDFRSALVEAREAIDKG